MLLPNMIRHCSVLLRLRQVRVHLLAMVLVLRVRGVVREHLPEVIHGFIVVCESLPLVVVDLLLRLGVEDDGSWRWRRPGWRALMLPFFYEAPFDIDMGGGEPGGAVVRLSRDTGAPSGPG